MKEFTGASESTPQRTLIPLNLQLFAEGDPSPTPADPTPSADPTPTPTGDPDLAAMLNPPNQDPAPPTTDPVKDNQPTAELFTIKVKGEEKQVTKDELIQLAQMGDDYTRKTQDLSREKQQLQSFQSQVQKLQEFGWPLEKILADFEQQQIAQQAEQMGMTPEAIQRLNQLEQRLSTSEEQLAYEKAMVDIESKADKLAKDPVHGEFFKENEVEILKRALELNTDDLELVMGKMYVEKLPEIRQKVAAAAEKEAIRKIQNRDKTIVDGSTNAGDTGLEGQLSAQQLAIATALGVSPQAYAKNIKK
jgi:hypothetical protein